ncbi:MAG TPA: DNA-binding protein [Anaerolineae bacterium]|nr:DNA-binding protein [Anaerolineae bacterium]
MAAKKKVAKKSAKKGAAKKAPVSRRKAVAAKKKVAARKRGATGAGGTRLKAITQRQTKTQILQAIAEDTDLTRKEVAAVFTALARLIKRHMQRRGSGEFSIPETGVKIRRVKRAAKKARPGRNPATGEAITIPAKPASTAIKVSALKALKDTLQ